MRSRTDAGRASGRAHCLALAAILGLGLLLLSFARVFGDLNSAAGHVSVLESAIDVPVWKTRLALNVLIFGATLAGLHLALGLACWCLAVAGEKAFPSLRISRREWLLLWFVAVSGCLLLSNAAIYPHSSLGEPYSAWADAVSILGIPLHEFLASLLVGAAIALVLLALLRSGRKARLVALTISSASLIVGAGASLDAAPPEPSGARPHIIVLGIDSLRGDLVDEALTPAIHSFLADSVWFEDAVTPLARTFPSWVSVLTGREPHTTGAIMNLLPREMVHAGATLPQLLRTHGYRTTYAIDETRFSNVDASYGFDQVIAPRMGGSDFVLSLAADTPLSNLVINTVVGEWLFPHIHANRAAHFTYDPDGFVARIRRNLQPDSPTLLVAHLTLAHYPYTWARSRADTGNDRLARGDYLEALSRVDTQFRDLMETLDALGFLRNAIVVVMSDHGEAIGRDDDLIEAGVELAGLDAESQRWGHGTSVFSPSQYRVVLGMRGYGPATQLLPAPGTLAAPVSLIDVAPTLLALLGLDAPDSHDGISLVQLFRSQDDERLRDRLRYTETEYNPAGFTSKHASPSAVAAAASVYRLDPVSDRIEIRADKLAWMLANRQFAAILGNRAIGAAIPSESPGSYRFVYLPLQEAPSQEDENTLRSALQGHFSLTLASPYGLKRDRPTGLGRRSPPRTPLQAHPRAQRLRRLLRDRGAPSA
jgi:arylsulfatase A-like enzyme